MDAYKIIDYFSKMDIDWFTFHIGSIVKGGIPTHQHLTEEQVRNVHLQLDNIIKIYPNNHIVCPVIYPSIGIKDDSRWYCMHPENNRAWLVYMSEDGIYGTNVPIVSNIDREVVFKLEEGKDINIVPYPEGDYCPLSKYTTGTTNTLCRYIVKKWN